MIQGALNSGETLGIRIFVVILSSCRATHACFHDTSTVSEKECRARRSLHSIRQHLSLLQDTTRRGILDPSSTYVMCNVYISGPHASARATVEAVVRAMQPLPGQQEEPALARAVQHHATVHLVATLVAVVGSTWPNSCGVRPTTLRTGA